MNHRLRLLLAAAVLLAPAAVRADDADLGGPNGPCRADVQKLCADVNPGGGALIKCLRDNRSQVSKGCQDRMARMRKRFLKNNPRIAAQVKACHDDRAKFCANTMPGEQTIACMKQHESELSERCRAAMSQKDGSQN